MYVNGITFT